MILYILQKGYQTETAKGIDELNALASKGFKFIKAVERTETDKSEEPENTDGNEDDGDKLICGICGKEYKKEGAYLKHIETCGKE